MSLLSNIPGIGQVLDKLQLEHLAHQDWSIFLNNITDIDPKLRQASQTLCETLAPLRDCEMCRNEYRNKSGLASMETITLSIGYFPTMTMPSEYLSWSIGLHVDTEIAWLTWHSFSL